VNRYFLSALEPWLILALALFFLFPQTWTLWALASLPLLWSARRVLSAQAFVRSSPANLPLLLLLLTILPAVRSASDLEAARQSLLFLVLGVALCWALMQHRLRRVEGALWTAALLSMAFSLALLLPLAVPDFSGGLGPLPGLTANLPAWLQERINANVLAGGLSLLSPFALAVLVARSPLVPQGANSEAGPAGGPPARQAIGIGLRLLALLSLIVSQAALAISQSRGALLAVLGTVMLLAALDWLTSRRWWLPALLAILVGLGLLSNPLLARVLPAPRLDETLTLAGRLPIWEAGLRMIGRSPLTGVGLGNFQRVMARDEPGASPLLPEGASHAHNLFLQVAADLGLVGLAAFLALYAFSLRAAYYTWRRSGGALPMGLFAALSAAALHGLVDAVQWGSKPAFLLWLFMGLALSLECEPSDRIIPRARRDDVAGRASP
jgi:O-antigen ligase